MAQQPKIGQAQRGVIAGLLCIAFVIAVSENLSSYQPVPPTKNSPPPAPDTEHSHKKKNVDYGMTADDWLALFTLALVFVGGFQVSLFYVQLKLIGESLVPAREAAEAAKLNAEAVMTAEGAQLFPVIKSHNLKLVFGHKLLLLNPSNPDTVTLETPHVIYSLKNYGKTPAKLFLIMHNIEYRPLGATTYEIAHSSDELALEVLGAGQESDEIECEMMAHFRWSEGNAVLNDKGELILTGTAFFRDFFDRQFICEWRCTGSRSGFKLVSHQQRLDPDAKKDAG